MTLYNVQKMQVIHYLQYLAFFSRHFWLYYLFVLKGLSQQIIIVGFCIVTSFVALNEIGCKIEHKAQLW